ncbi:MAG: PQQ-dependent sugar dehydrogenase [Alphaproteobacteria bacterium]|nr:PQQ-dependent sugar dehydrogenase [Alphaproteobacteria bacterium]
MKSTLLLAALLTATAAASPILQAPADGDPSAYTIEPVATGLDNPWSLAFLPDGSMLVVERDAGLRVIRGGKLDPKRLDGLPPAYVQNQGGYFDVVLDPAYASNGLIYVAYAEGTDAANHTAVARARFDGTALHDVTVIFRNTPEKDTTAHYGGRMVFLPDGTLLLTTGDGFEFREQAQDLASGLGKIIRIDTSGNAPADNPFAGQPVANAKVWTYGHRNQQGLARDSITGRIYQTEHGALSGDEVNLIEKGANYGWPIATYSVDYSGSVISPFTEKEGTTQPIAVWKPERFAPSGLTVYRGRLFPQWDGDLLAGSLAEMRVDRLDLDDTGKVVGWQRLFGELQTRIRDVRTGPDGAIYLLTDEDDGKVLKVTPR